MNVRNRGTMPVRVEQDVVLARQAVRRVAQECGLRLVDQTKLITAASELARNAVIYGGGGDMDWEILEDGVRSGKLAMTDGWTSGSGLGLGLTGAKRLVNEFELDSAPGKGTRVTIARWT